MPVLSASEVAACCGGRVLGDPDSRVSGFAVDSRVLEPGFGFAAVQGGEAYVADALAAGAGFVLVDASAAVPSGASAVVVEDVERALTVLATEVGDRLNARVVGVTGSAGKTLTKDFLAAAAGARFRVHASPRSFNNEIGVPLVVLSCPSDAEVLVVELGARRTGDIAHLCRIVRPEIGVLTGIGLTHLGIFGTPEAIARTKAELLAALPVDGVAIIPTQDNHLALLASSTPARVVGVGPGGRVRIGAVTLDPDGATGARVVVGEEAVDVRIPVAGRPIVRNAALALAAAVELGVEPARAAEALSRARPSSWRMEILRSGSRTIVNDAYNANPTSTAAALRTVREIAGDRPAWAVLGEMAELGPAAAPEHARMGRLAAGLGFQRVVVVGAGAAPILEGAGPIGETAADALAAARIVADSAPEDAVVLVKGSRVAGLERTVDALIGPVAADAGVDG